VDTDAVVIGAGPAGTAAGEYIAREGYEATILEKRRSPGRNKICGGALSKKSFNDLGLPKAIIEKECPQFMVHFPEGNLRVPSKPGFILFDRENLDQVLAQRAANNGARLMNSTLVSDVTICDNGLAVHFRNHQSGELGEIRARIVIFADGTSTIAYRKFKIGFSRRSDETALAAAYDLRCTKNPLNSLDFHFSDEISPFGYGWIFPKKHSMNIGVLCLLSKIQQNIRDHLDYFVSSAGLGSRKVIRFGCRLIPQSCAKVIFTDSILVVGDAAGTADPIDGGGIFNALVSGKVAGKVAAEALEFGNVSTDFLAKYEDLWKNTENYKLLKRSFFIHRLALKANVNIGIFLKQMGFFEQYDCVK
jgi:digeranylgeranylglycerophospholipid reductase